jgi:hypothetical protein
MTVSLDLKGLFERYSINHVAYIPSSYIADMSLYSFMKDILATTEGDEEAFARVAVLATENTSLEAIQRRFDGISEVFESLIITRGSMFMTSQDGYSAIKLLLQASLRMADTRFAVREPKKMNPVSADIIVNSVITVLDSLQLMIPMDPILREAIDRLVDDTSKSGTILKQTYRQSVMTRKSQ